MKFYFDGEKICTSKAHNYTHAIVYPAKPGAGKKWQLQSRHSSLHWPRPPWQIHGAG